MFPKTQSIFFYYFVDLFYFMYVCLYSGLINCSKIVLLAFIDNNIQHSLFVNGSPAIIATIATTLSWSSSNLPHSCWVALGCTSADNPN